MSKKKKKAATLPISFTCDGNFIDAKGDVKKIKPNRITAVSVGKKIKIN